MRIGVVEPTLAAGARLGNRAAASKMPHASRQDERNDAMVERENVFPEGLSKRVVGGHLLYAPVVTVVPGKLVLLSGILARNSQGEIVGKGDMRRQIQQVYENIRTALAAVGATMADIVRRQTFTTDIDAYFQHVGARMEYLGDSLSTSTTVEVRRLSHPDFLVEVEVMAVIKS
jgi:2-iminobutanoate/2-iminopropanoate deaminase